MGAVNLDGCCVEQRKGMVGGVPTEQLKDIGLTVKEKPSALGILIDPNYEWTGIEFTGSQVIGRVWELTCPCGVTDVFPLNGLPEVDTRHSCGNPKHWTLKYKRE